MHKILVSRIDSIKSPLLNALQMNAALTIEGLSHEIVLLLFISSE